MTSFAARERALLCDLAELVGPDAPTLSGEWTVRDLVSHLLVRERHPAAVGIVVSPLAGWHDAEVDKGARDDFESLVDRLRAGPPFWSPFALPVLGDLANVAEYFVHHEDVRRAGDGWEPRGLDPDDQDLLWKVVLTLGRTVGAQAPVGVVAVRTDADGRATVRRPRRGTGTVEVRGTPEEIVLFLYGRQDQARVELDGEPDDVARLSGASLGL